MSDMTPERIAAVRSRPFPIMREVDKRNAKPGPTSIPWSVAEKAYHVYSSRYGTSQSLERLAERGGFYSGEMDDFFPGWRDEVAEITALRARIAELEKEREAALSVVERVDRAYDRGLLYRDEWDYIAFGKPHPRIPA